MESIDRALGGRMFIGGEWREARSGATFAVFDPGNDTEIAQVADGAIDDGLDAIDAAHRAAASWAEVPPRRRGEVLRRAFELMIAQRESLAHLITRENGKALRESLAEVDYAAEFFRWFSEEAVRGVGELTTSPGGAYRMLTSLQPVGLSVFVTPWNFPAAMATRKIGPALAAGCTTVLKPAAETPLTALAIAQVLAEAGVPAGVVNVVTTKRSAGVVGTMLDDPRVRKVSFTGSTEVGRVLLEQAARRVLRTSMELGGNGPFIVLDDADLEVAVASAMVAKFRNGGQSCTAANRFFVHARVKEEFCARFAAAMDQIHVGYGLDDGVEIGSLINARALDDVLCFIDDANDRGASTVTGGTRLGNVGNFMRPALLMDVPLDARCMHDEIFGPVAPVASFESVDEAIELANATEFGLVAFVQSRDIGRALAVADRLESGMVGINRGVVSDPAAPFGGWKQSGLGREGHHLGLLEFLETKYVAVDW